MTAVKEIWTCKQYVGGILRILSSCMSILWPSLELSVYLIQSSLTKIEARICILDLSQGLNEHLNTSAMPSHNAQLYESHTHPESNKSPNHLTWLLQTFCYTSWLTNQAQFVKKKDYSPTTAIRDQKLYPNQQEDLAANNTLVVSSRKAVRLPSLNEVGVIPSFTPRRTSAVGSWDCTRRQVRKPVLAKYCTRSNHTGYGPFWTFSLCLPIPWRWPLWIHRNSIHHHLH